MAWPNCSVVVVLRLPPSTTARISPSSNLVSIDSAVFIRKTPERIANGGSDEQVQPGHQHSFLQGRSQESDGRRQGPGARHHSPGPARQAGPTAAAGT